MSKPFLTRREVYRLVWSRPVQQVAAIIGISGNSLAKTCHTRGIPTPERGYWARIQNGQLSKIPPLGEVEFELPTPWEKSDIVEAMLAKIPELAQSPVEVDASTEERAEPFVYASVATTVQETEIRPTKAQKESGIDRTPGDSGEASSNQEKRNHIGAPSNRAFDDLPQAVRTALVWLDREKQAKELEQLCARVEALASTMPTNIESLINQWVLAIRTHTRGHNAQSQLISYCINLLREDE